MRAATAVQWGTGGDRGTHDSGCARGSRCGQCALRTAPALQVARVDANDSLQAAAGRTVAGGRGKQLRDAFVVAEIALTVILLTGGGLLLRSLVALQHVSLGFRPEHVLAMEATPQNGQRAKSFFTGLLGDVSVLPGVIAIGAISAPPGNVDSTSAYWIDHLPKELNFNIGVELGQVIALTAVLLVLSYWRTRPGFIQHAFVTNGVLMACGFLLVGYQLSGYFLGA